MSRRRKLAARFAFIMAVGLIPTLSATAPARADTYGGDPSSAMVTRLSLTDGRGWLTVQARVSQSVIGIEVFIPAAGGSWSGPADVDVPGLGTHCRRVVGPDLWYLCGASTWPTEPGQSFVMLPSGTFTITLPVTRTGSLSGLSGLVGRAWVDLFTGGGDIVSFGRDTFPVIDVSHWRSTAEVGRAIVTYDGRTTKTYGRVTVPVLLTVAPGERVSALDVTLSRKGRWSLESTNAASSGATCVVRRTASGDQILQCVGSHGAALPSGSHVVTANLHFYGVDLVLEPGLVGLGVEGRTVEPVDSFDYFAPYLGG